MIVFISQKMTDELDYYEVLGCSPNATIDDLKKAYHKKVLEEHPDKNKDSNNRIFHRINKAWEVLKNPESRKEYDNECKKNIMELRRVTIYAHVSLRDLKSTEDTDVVSYPCRCGSFYLIQNSDIQEQNCVLQIPCEDCSFVIEVET